MTINPEQILTISTDKYIELYNLDVSAYIDKKQNFAYLSWSWAWHLLKIHFPNYIVTHHESPEGQCYFIDPITKEGYIKPYIIDLSTGKYSISVDYPIMNFKNQAVKIYEEKLVGEQVILTPSTNRMEIQKNVFRAYTKCIAMVTGIGLKLWNGEDLTNSERDSYISRIINLGESFKEISGSEHPELNKIYTMTNQDLIKFGKDLKLEISKLPPKKETYPEI
jgi:hypothetical protein